MMSAVVWLVVLSASLAVALGKDTLVYSVTYRDVLSSHCLNETEYVDAWEFTPSYGGVADSVYNPSVNISGLTGNSPGQFQPSQLHGNSDRNKILLSEYCPYFDFMRNFTVIGNADFDASGSGFQTGASECFFGGSPQACKSITSIIAPEMEMQPSGLRKVVYCDRTSPSSRCGKQPTGSLYGTSNAKYFESWFKDDQRFNKRLGSTIVLTPTAVPNQFQFKPSAPGFFPLDVFDRVTEEAWPNPFEAPMWPSAQVGIMNRIYSFTTELHTFFEYRGDESFTFKGDDDVWVWINGKIAVDLGNLHGAVERVIVLSDHATVLGLEVGGIYEFDFFHAERHYSGSNFELTTTLASTCNVALSGSVVFSQDDPDNDASDFLLSRGAQLLPSGALALTSSTLTAPFASAHTFHTTQINVGAGFLATFTFTASSAVEGLAFVFHQRPDGLEDLPASTGSSLGFRYLTRSVAVVFDLCLDRAEGTCDLQDVRIHYPNDDVDSFNTPELDTMQKYDPIMRNLRLRDEPHTVRVEYLENPDWLEVYIDDSLYLRQQNFSVSDVIGGRDAFVGFTSATGATPGDLVITDWNITAVVLNAAGTESVDLEDPKSILADGDATASFTVKTFDLCNNTVSNGGSSDFLKGFLVTEDNTTDVSGRRRLANETIINATVVDNLDGTYSAQIATDLPGDFSLYLCFGEDCGFDEDWNNITSADDHFYAFVPSALTVVALTPEPTQSPVVFVPLEGDNSESVVIASAAGGSAGALFVFAAIVLLLMRRKWQRDKAFINEGMLYNMEQDVTYDKNDEFAVVGRMVMSTQQEILRERAQKTATPLDTEIGELESQKAELQEQLRVQKQMKAFAPKDAASIFAKGKAKPKKKEFASDQLEQ